LFGLAPKIAPELLTFINSLNPLEKLAMTGLKVSQKRRSLRRVVKLAAPISSAPDIVRLQRIDTVAIII
jgi:hypothetical protein